MMLTKGMIEMWRTSLLANERNTDETRKQINDLCDMALQSILPTTFFVATYRADRGYPVCRGGHDHQIAWFVTESEASEYARHRNELLARFGTTDENAG